VIPDAGTAPSAVTVSDLRSTSMNHTNVRSLVAIETDYVLSFGSDPSNRLWRYNASTRQLIQITAPGSDMGIAGATPIKAAAYVPAHSRIVWWDDDNVVRDGVPTNIQGSARGILSVRTVTGFTEESPPEGATYHAASGTFLLPDGEDVGAWRYDASAGSLERVHTSSAFPDQIEACALIPGTEIMIFIYRDDLTMHWARWNPAASGTEPRFGPVQDLDAALPDSVSDTAQTAMTVSNGYLLYHVATTNDFRSYAVSVADLTFSEHGSSDPLSLGDILSGQGHPVWIRRTVEAADRDLGPAGVTLTIRGDSP